VSAALARAAALAVQSAPDAVSWITIEKTQSPDGEREIWRKPALGAAKSIEKMLGRLGWEVEARGAAEPPRRMARFAAAELHTRRITLFPPHLRWVAENTGSEPDAFTAWSRIRAALAEEAAPAFRESPPESADEIEALLRAVALAHELFHILTEASPESGWPELAPPPAQGEREAERFACLLTAALISMEGA